MPRGLTWGLYHFTGVSLEVQVVVGFRESCFWRWIELSCLERFRGIVWENTLFWMYFAGVLKVSKSFDIILIESWSLISDKSFRIYSFITCWTTEPKSLPLSFRNLVVSIPLFKSEFESKFLGILVKFLTNLFTPDLNFVLLNISFLYETIYSY